MIPLIPASFRNLTNVGKYQAIAYSYVTKTVARSWNWSNTTDSWKAAAKQCNLPDCQIVGGAVNACVAFAVSDSQEKGRSAWNAVESIARNNALSECQARHGSDCRIVASTCPVP